MTLFFVLLGIYILGILVAIRISNWIDQLDDDHVQGDVEGIIMCAVMWPAVVVIGGPVLLVVGIWYVLNRWFNFKKLLGFK